jgi:hypothetical protein
MLNLVVRKVTASLTKSNLKKTGDAYIVIWRRVRATIVAVEEQ